MKVASQDLSDDDFTIFAGLAKKIAGIELGPAKRDLVISRLVRRVRALKLECLNDYRRYLTANLAVEESHFVNAITTNLTSFFRERHHFDYLAEMATSNTVGDINVWSSACSTGQESYSIAMTLFDAGLAGRYKITATDIDTQCLNKAQQGIYALSDIEGLDIVAKKKHFQAGSGSNTGLVRVKKHLQEQVSYSHLNLMQEWQHPTLFHVIFCRNVFIYFNDETQQMLLRRFAKYLHVDGILFLGHSESLKDSSKLFSMVGRTTYRRCHG